MLRPLGDRVLIKPLEQPTTSESGLIHVVEDKKPDEMGTVVAVGFATHPKRDDVLALVESLKNADEPLADEEVELLEGLVRREPCVKVGDIVLFSWASGQELTLNDGEERYLLMREDDLLAVLESAE